MPQRFGKYTLIRKLATGGMAELFLAIQRSVAGFEKLIVIKRILPSMNQDRAFIDMLLHEARVTATLSHPNIVHIFDVGQTNGQFFIAMEHVHGEDLRSIVRQMRRVGVKEFPMEHALGIVLGTCAGLAYAHEKKELDGSPLNIVHRDISPQNTVVTFTGDVKIVDFGIAKSATTEKLAMEETKDGKLKGKVPYMSPEQARGEPIDWRSDIFSVGVMLFELTTGRRLFKGASEFETLKLIIERDYPYPSMVHSAYPPQLELIVMRALSKRREDRFQSAREMQQALEDFVRENGLRVSSIALSEFMQRLFEEKLATQKQALLEGKQLADIIAMQERRDSEPWELDPSGPQRRSQSLSMPGAAHTVTDAEARKRGLSTAFLAAAMALVVVLVIAGAVTMYVLRMRHAAATSMAVAPSDQALVRGSIRVTSDPPGASIWIDGDLRTEVTPATIQQLPLKSIDVKLTKDGYESQKQSVVVSGADPATVSATLRKGVVVVEVSAKPQGAKVILTLDGQPTPGTTINNVSAGEPHNLVVSAPGYGEQNFSFSGSAFDKKHFDVVLEKEARRSATAIAPAQSSPAAAASTGTGKLNVGSVGGWCNVTVDGVARGATPVAGLELPAGPHRVTCTPPDGKTQQTTVNVAADTTARHKFTLAP
jgi:serine/threonine-protein kinase